MNRAPSDRAAVPERSEGYIPFFLPLSLLLVGCYIQPLTEPPATLGKLAAEDTTQPVTRPAFSFPPLEPMYPTVKDSSSPGPQGS